MANIFDEFDSKVEKGFAAKVKEAAENSDFPEVPAGKYIAKIEKMDMTKTKKDGRPMFTVQMRLLHGVTDKEEKFLAGFKNKKPCVFMNRVVFGTKNDAAMIGAVVGFLNKIVDDPENPVVFTTYGDFYEDILDIAEDVAALEFEITYDESKFNSIVITEVFES